MADTLKHLWRGEVPLAVAFWTWAVLGGLIVNVVTTGLFLGLLVLEQTVLAMVAGYGLSAPYNILVLVGVWRAADRYPGERAWAETARIVALVGLVVLSVT